MSEFKGTKSYKDLVKEHKQMLEMLKEIIYSDSDVEDVYRRAKQLIKEATEL